MSVWVRIRMKGPGFALRHPDFPYLGELPVSDEWSEVKGRSWQAVLLRTDEATKRKFMIEIEERP